MIGPVMIGPSSSHTAGVVRIGRTARKILGDTPEEAEIIFYNSFARTYEGHGSDLAIIAGLTDICGEVGGGKILEPFEQYDSTKTESPFSHNSITDFTNNLKGAQNVFLCTYNGQSGASMSNFISARNIALDTKIKNQFAAAITALSNISTTFESAIYSQRTQLQNAMNAIYELQATLDGEAKLYVQTYVTD